MRLRIRGPSGQSTVKIDDNATVDDLRSTIAAETSLSAFDIKYSYPPKALDLSQYPSTKLLSELDIKLNGEQLIISRKETAPVKATPGAVQQPQSETSRSKAGPSSSSASASQPQRPDADSDPGLLSLTRKQNKEMADPPEISVPDVGGTLVLRIMPDDNSCLFRAVSSAVMSEMDAVRELRSIVAEQIVKDPVTYNKAVLDNKEPEKYAQWINGSDSWGGQVELLILSQYFQTEICSIDVQTLRVDHYNEGAARRCFVVYSGIHYDTIALTIPGMAPEDDVKQFESPIKDEILPKAVELCKKLQEMHYFTDTSGFRVRCNDCGAEFSGQKAALEHASKTEHYNFGEA